MKLPFVRRSKASKAISHLVQTHINVIREIFMVTDTMSDVLMSPAVDEAFRNALATTGGDPTASEDLYEAYRLLRQKHYVIVDTYDSLLEEQVIDEIVHEETKDIDREIHRFLSVGGL